MTYTNFSRKPFEGSLNSFVDNLFTELPVLFKNEFNQTIRKDFVPVNVKETEKSYQLEVVAPGFEKSDFKVNLDQDLLTISFGRKNEGEENEKQICKEYN